MNALYSKLTTTILIFMISVCTYSETNFVDLLLSKVENTGEGGENNAVVESNSFKVIKLKKVKPKNPFYSAVSMPAKSGPITSSTPGLVRDIKRKGDFVLGTIRDIDDNIVRKGTVVALIEDYDYLSDLEDYEIEMNKIKSDYAYSSKILAQAEKLVKKNLIPQSDYVVAQGISARDMLRIKEQEMDINRVKFQLENTSITAPFTGVITDLDVVEGTYVSEGDVLLYLTQIDQLIVVLDFPFNIIDLIKPSALLIAFPSNANKPFICSVFTHQLYPTKIFAILKNKQMYNRYLTQREKELPKAFQIFPVIRTFSEMVTELEVSSKIPLAIPEEALRNDENGDYVFRVKGYRQDKISALPDTINVEKIYVELGDIQLDYEYELFGDTEILSLSDDGGLDIGDLVIGSSEDDVSEKREVVLVEKLWAFMPMQEIDVKIPTLSKEGYYVPEDSVISTGKNYYVYMADRNKAKLTRVNITGYWNGYIAISGEDIVDNKQVIVISEKKQLSTLYHNADIQVTGTIKGIIDI